MANDPLLFGTPGLDYRYLIFLYKDGDRIKYTIIGAHDGFPAYSIYIGKVNVYYQHNQSL